MTADGRGGHVHQALAFVERQRHYDRCEQGRLLPLDRLERQTYWNGLELHGVEGQGQVVPERCRHWRIDTFEAKETRCVRTISTLVTL